MDNKIGRRKFLEQTILGIAGVSILDGCGPGPDPFPLVVKYTREETNQNLKMDEGVNLTSWWCDDYSKPHIETTLLKLHDLGVESIAFLMTYYQAAANSTYM